MMGVSVLLWYVILNVLFVNIGKFNIYLVWCKGSPIDEWYQVLP